jgi:hypothetical protein
MRNLLALFATAVLTFAGVGWYLGWYRVQSKPAADGHRAYNVDVDAKKIGEDLHRGGERLQEALDKKSKEVSVGKEDTGKPVDPIPAEPT